MRSKSHLQDRQETKWKSKADANIIIIIIISFLHYLFID